MKVKTLIAGVAATAVLSLGMVGAAAATTYTYVGSWAVADGPDWHTDPVVLTGQEAAALLFGGVASDYAISTIDNNPLNINFMAHEDGYGDTTYLTGAVAENYSLSSEGGGGYASYPSFSAYVFDHACGVYYCAEGGGENAINYAFKIGGVPEPASWALMIAGFGLAGASLRSRRRQGATAA